MSFRCGFVVSLPLLLATLATSAPGAEDWRETTARVDELLAQRWNEAGVSPAPRATDAEFARRAHLDLTGVIPTVGEIRRFLDDERPGKRGRLIERLLGKPNHPTHLADVWKRGMLPRTDNPAARFRAGTFRGWLREHFAENTPYDEMARELLTAEGSASAPGPLLYYTRREVKPQKLAAGTSRFFLGVQIECAQCHDHPFDRWTQRDFWGYAAFFARLERPGRRQAARPGLQLRETDSGEVTLPGSDEVVPPRFLGSADRTVDASASRRRELAAWMTVPENPYFARAAVNRVWALLFGYGLVDPVDDFGDHNPPSHPRLLDELAADFVEHGYDVRRLLRILANTRAYGLSSESSPSEPADPRLFGRMTVKTLTAGQLVDCLAQAACLRESPGRAANGPYGRQRRPRREAFLRKFGSSAHKPTEYRSGIPQALTMMNGEFMDELTDAERSDILAALVAAPFFTDTERVETLFLATLSRYPTDREREKFVGYVETGGRTGDRGEALGDVLWALLNGPEFVLNH